MYSEVAEHLDSPYNKLQWMGEEYLLDELKDEKLLGTDGEKYSPEVLYTELYGFRTLDPEVAIGDLIEIHQQRQMKVIAKKKF